MQSCLPSESAFGKLEQIFAFYGAMPTGVTISETGRIFVCFPKWGDVVPYTVAEIIQNELVPYPNQIINNSNYKNPKDTFISVQSVIADGKGFLWVLDTGAPNFSAPIKDGAKLVKIDLNTNKIVDIYTFSENVVLSTTYLNDIRFNPSTEEKRYAYITDSSIYGPGAIIVLDLKTRRAYRKLSGSIYTSVDSYFVPKIEGKVWMNRSEKGEISPVHIAVDGIAISPNGEVIYFSSLSSRYLYGIETKYLRNLSISEKELEKYVFYIIEKGASDGMITDKEGNIYIGDYENNSIQKISLDGMIQTILHSPYILWPDTLTIGKDGYLYFIANQLHRQPGYHYGRDLRQKPYSLFRTYIGMFPNWYE